MFFFLCIHIRFIFGDCNDYNDIYASRVHVLKKSQHASTVTCPAEYQLQP